MHRKNNMQTFEDYLKEIHAKEYMGTDDEVNEMIDETKLNLPNNK